MVILENMQTWSYKIPALPRAPLVAQTVKNPPAMPENPGLILGGFVSGQGSLGLPW